MQRLEARTGQLGLVGGVRQAQSNQVTVVEPATPFAPEARKGRLYLVTEANADAPKAVAACQLVARAAKHAFYEDTSFSITAALRVAIRAANKALYEQNFNLAAPQRAYVGLTCAVLRDGDLFVAQVQPAQAYVLSAGRVRAMPAHPSWDPAHVSAAPFERAGALGVSLFIEPEMYRCTLAAGDGALLCTSNFAHLLGRAEIDAALRQGEPTPALERLQQVAEANGLGDAHALALTIVAIHRPTAREVLVGPAPAEGRGRLAVRAIGGWLTGRASEVAQLMGQ